MSFDELPTGLTEAQRRDIDMRTAEKDIEDDVHDFRQFAEAMLRRAPSFLAEDELYASLCDLADNHPVYLTDFTSAQAEMDRWNNVLEVAHDALPRLEAAIRADLA